MKEYGSFELGLAKEITLKAMEVGILKAANSAESKPEESAKAIASFFNELLQSIKT